MEFGVCAHSINQLTDEAMAKCYDFISRLAKQFNTNIVAGSIANKTEKGIYNTAFSVARNGALLNKTIKFIWCQC